MKAIILAAGEGKRMWPIGQEKYLLPFLGQPLLYHTLKRIKDAVNFDEAVIVTKEPSKGQVSKIASNLGLNYKIAIQSESKGMADAVLSAKQLIDSEILVINDAVKRVIRNDELIQLPTIIQTGSAFKMKSFSESIKQYFEQGLIDGEAYAWYSRGV